MTQFRKKPVIIEAHQFTGGPDVASSLLSWIISGGGTGDWAAAGHDGTERIMIETLEGRMRAEVGDWIIQGVAGEFYPCKPDIFVATYEEIPYSDVSQSNGEHHD